MLSERTPRAWLTRQLLLHRRTVLSVVIVGGVLLSAFASLDEWGATRGEIEKSFRSDAAEHFDTLREEVGEALNSAASVADFFQVVGSVDQHLFLGFVTPHLSRARGLVSLVWIPRIPDGSRARFEAEGRREWGPAFHIFERGSPDRPIGRRAEYFPVCYWATLSGPGNPQVIGQDWGPDPVKAEAFQRARDTGQPAMTRKLRLTRGAAGVHVYWPIYQKGAPRNTIEERRASLRGFIGAGFDIGELMESSLAQLSPRGIEISLAEAAEPPEERLLYDRPARLTDPPPSRLARLVTAPLLSGLQWTNSLAIGGRRWTVALVPTLGYVPARLTAAVWEDLLIGLVTTGLVGGYLLLLMRRTDEGERLVASRTQELQQAHDRLLAEVAERARAEAVAQSHAAQLEAVRTVSLEVIREVDLGHVLTLVARQAGDLLRTGTSTVWLWDEAAQVLVPRAWHGPGEWHHVARLRLGEGVVGTVAARGQGLLVNDYRTSPYALAVFLERTRTTAVVAEPLLYRDQLLGVLGVDNECTGRPFTDQDRQILALFAAQAAIAIHTAQLFDEVLAGRAQARRLTQQILSVQEEERRHLSRELHDDAGQTLTTLGLTLRRLQVDVPVEHAALRRQLHEAEALAQSTVERIRRLARDLRPPALDTLGLTASLADLCREVSRRTGLEVTFTATEIPPLPEGSPICLYRVLQEALTNVAKHAHATRVGVTLRRAAEAVCLAVEDNGQGFDAGRVRVARSRAQGIGILGMQERLELLGGHLELGARPGTGTRLVARVPTARGASAAGVLSGAAGRPG